MDPPFTGHSVLTVRNSLASKRLKPIPNAHKRSVADSLCDRMKILLTSFVKKHVVIASPDAVGASDEKYMPPKDTGAENTLKFRPTKFSSVLKSNSIFVCACLSVVVFISKLKVVLKVVM